MMDREKKDQLPKMQVGFIDAICLPVYKNLANVEPLLTPLHSGCQGNRDNWQSLSEERALIRENEKTTGTKVKDEKAFLEREKQKKMSKVASLEGGTPSNTPPPLTPSHTQTSEPPQKAPISPLATEEKKPSLTRQDAATKEPPAAPAPTAAPAAPAPPAAQQTKTDVAPTPTSAKVDKNGKVVKAAAESNGNNDIAAAAQSNHKAASPTQRRNKSKLCNVL
ncbi:uncharacterized protein [Amphiura filiformis]|uniref:uncharacterized protein n=1 Tax=Amphiura filiformis TaxID=82378 RepID=UPI003B21FE11